MGMTGSEGGGGGRQREREKSGGRIIFYVSDIKSQVNTVICGHILDILHFSCACHMRPDINRK